MKKLMICFVSLSMVLALAGCSDSDDKNPTRTDILGLWVEDPTFNNTSNYCYEFKSDGSLIWRVYNKYAIERTETKTYTTLGDTIRDEDGDALVKSCTSTQLVLVNPDINVPFTFTKITSLPYTNTNP